MGLRFPCPVGYRSGGFDAQMLMAYPNEEKSDTGATKSTHMSGSPLSTEAEN